MIFIQADLSKDGDCIIKTIIAISLDAFQDIKHHLLHQAMRNMTAFSGYHFIANPLPNL